MRCYTTRWLTVCESSNIGFKFKRFGATIWCVAEAITAEAHSAITSKSAATYFMVDVAAYSQPVRGRQLLSDASFSVFVTTWLSGCSLFLSPQDYSE